MGEGWKRMYIIKEMNKMNALQKKAILKALEPYGIQDWAGLEAEAAAAGKTVEEYLTALDIAVPASATVPAPTAKPVKKIVKPEAPAPVAVDNTAAIVEAKKNLELAQAMYDNAAPFMKAVAEQMLTMARAEYEKVAPKPAKKAPKAKVALAPAKLGDILGKANVTGVGKFPYTADLWTMLDHVRFQKVDGHNDATMAVYFDTQYRMFGRGVLQGNWKDAIMDDFTTDETRVVSAVFVFRSWAPSEGGGACATFYPYAGGAGLPEEGDVMAITWDYKNHCYVVGEPIERYKFERQNGADEARDHVQIPAHSADDRSQVQVPKGKARTTKA